MVAIAAFSMCMLASFTLPSLKYSQSLFTEEREQKHRRKSDACLKNKKKQKGKKGTFLSLYKQCKNVVFL